MSSEQKMQLVLKIASKQNSLFKNSYPDFYNSVNALIEKAYNWVLHKKGSAAELHAELIPLVEFEYKLKKASTEKHAYLSIIHALYYITWHADNYDRRMNPGLPLLTNEMADMDESVAQMCVDEADLSGMDDSHPTI